MDIKSMEKLLADMKRQEREFYHANKQKMESLHPNADTLAQMHSDFMQEISSLEEEIAFAYQEAEEAEDARKEAVRLTEVGL